MLQVQIEITCNIFVHASDEQFSSVGITIDIAEVSSIPDFVLPYIAFDALSRDLLSTDYTSFVDEATDMTYVYRR